MFIQKIIAAAFIVWTSIPAWAGNFSVFTSEDGDKTSLYTNCEFNHVEATCRIDTGSSRSYAPTQSELATLPTLEIRHILVGQNNRPTRIVRLERLAAFGEEAGQLPIMLLDRSLPTYTLGSDFFAGRSWSLNFDQSNIHPAAELSVTAAEMDVATGLPLIQLEISSPEIKRTILALLDTGSHRSLFDESFVRENADMFQGGEESLFIQTVEDKKYNTESIYPRRLRLGDELLPKKRFLILDLSALSQKIDRPVHAVLGMNVIAMFNWTLDYKNGRYTVKSRHLPSTGESEPLRVKVAKPELLMIAKSGEFYKEHFTGELGARELVKARVYLSSTVANAGAHPVTVFAGLLCYLKTDNLDDYDFDILGMERKTPNPRLPEARFDFAADFARVNLTEMFPRVKPAVERIAAAIKGARGEYIRRDEPFRNCLNRVLR